MALADTCTHLAMIPGAMGPRGFPGTNGKDGENAFTTLTENFSIPAVGGEETITVASSDWVAVGQPLFIYFGGSGYKVVSVPDSTHIRLTNLGNIDNSPPGTLVPIGSPVVPTGFQGPSAADGETGPAGPAGISGPQGDPGPEGPAGPAGATGATGGSALQMVSAFNNTTDATNAIIPFDDTIPQSTEGLEIITLNITPININSRLVIEALIPFSTAAIADITLALFKDAQANAIAATFQDQPGNAFPNQIALMHVHAPGSLDPIMFRLRIGASNGTELGLNGQDAGAGSVRKYGGVQRGWLIVTEWAPVSGVVLVVPSELEGWFKRKSLDEGRSIPTSPTNVHLEINGNETGGDGFSGDFTWQDDLTQPDDGANFLRPSDGLVGGWVRKT